jgi:hypothetical protein
MYKFPEKSMYVLFNKCMIKYTKIIFFQKICIENGMRLIRRKIRYINAISLSISSISKPVLFADDISIIISSINREDFCSVSNVVLSLMIKWFAANKVVLNLDETNVMKFITIYHILHYILVIKKII